MKILNHLILQISFFSLASFAFLDKDDKFGSDGEPVFNQCLKTANHINLNIFFERDYDYLLLETSNKVLNNPSSFLQLNDEKIPLYFISNERNIQNEKDIIINCPPEDFFWFKVTQLTKNDLLKLIDDEKKLSLFDIHGFLGILTSSHKIFDYSLLYLTQRNDNVRLLKRENNHNPPGPNDPNSPHKKPPSDDTEENQRRHSNDRENKGFRDPRRPPEKGSENTQNRGVNGRNDGQNDKNSPENAHKRNDNSNGEGFFGVKSSNPQDEPRNKDKENSDFSSTDKKNNKDLGRPDDNIPDEDERNSSMKKDKERINAPILDDPAENTIYTQVIKKTNYNEIGIYVVGLLVFLIILLFARYLIRNQNCCKHLWKALTRISDRVINTRNVINEARDASKEQQPERSEFVEEQHIETSLQTIKSGTITEFSHRERD